VPLWCRQLPYEYYELSSNYCSWECATASPNSSKKEQVEGYYDIYKIKIVKRNSIASIVTMLIIGKVI